MNALGLFLGEVGLDTFSGQSNPAAGANVTNWTVGALGFRSQVLGIRMRLATDATVANRRLQLLFSVGDATLPDIFVAQSQVDHPASTTVDYFFAPGYADSVAVVDGRVLVRLPFPIEMVSSGTAAGWTISTDVLNISAADQLSNIQAYVRGSSGA